eukprot:13050647-Alexandrium_andersonii.AAC.1
MTRARRSRLGFRPAGWASTSRLQGSRHKQPPQHRLARPTLCCRAGLPPAPDASLLLDFSLWPRQVPRCARALSKPG